ncbi:MAG: formate dehydrogenase accessory sulfurtransferase FdhD [Gemmatimonadaceae bacterium]
MDTASHGSNASHALFALGYMEPTSEAPVGRLSETDTGSGTVIVAEEVPIALVYNGRPHVVVMGTPADLEDLTVGFSVTESIVANMSGIERVEVVKASHGIELQIQISAADAQRLEARTRSLVSRTSCGLCGIETIKDVLRVPDTLSHSLDVSREAIFRAGLELSKRQTLNNETSTVHAAAWSSRFGEVLIVREDVGRHNALDKVLGAMIRSGVAVDDGFIVVTSRASYEMVQKVAVCGVELIAAISRPTGLAIRFAVDAGVTLVGLLRGTSANVYTGPQRIT